VNLAPRRRHLRVRLRPEGEVAKVRFQLATEHLAKGGPPLFEAPTHRHHLSPTRSRQSRQNRGVRITFDHQADAVYIHLSKGELPPGRTTTVKAQPSEDIEASDMLDRKDDCLFGIDVPDANVRLPQDLLDSAEIID
jgi:hypothetical protein